MSAAAVWSPKKPIWLKSSVVAATALVALYVAIAWSRPWQPGRFWGLTYGTIAALLFLNAGLYPLRRRLGARPLANVQQWLQLHVYGTTIAMLLVLIHMGFRWPGGMFGWWLFGLSLWTTLTGMLGVFLQKWVPVTIAKNLKVEALYVRIPGLMEKLAADAATLAAASGDALRRVYESDVRVLLAAPTSPDSASFASPKSSTFTVPSARTLMFAGFRSRWMNPCSCAASSASAICFAIGSASSIIIGPRAIRSASVSPSTSSSTSAWI